MVATVDTSSSFSATPPRELFRGGYEPAYDVAADGQRFLMIKSSDGSSDRHIHWLTGWTRELRTKLAARETP